MRAFALIAFESSRCRSKVVCVTSAENDEYATRKFGCERIMPEDKDSPSQELLVGVCNYLMTSSTGNYRGMVVRMSRAKEGEVARTLELYKELGYGPEWIVKAIKEADLLMVSEVPYLL